jgi:hypothetical protein
MPVADVTSADKHDPVRLYNLVDAIPRRGGETEDKRFYRSRNDINDCTKDGEN